MCVMVSFADVSYKGGGQSAFLSQFLLRTLADVPVRDADRDNPHGRPYGRNIFRYCPVEPAEDGAVFYRYNDRVLAAGLVEKVCVERLYIPYVIDRRIPVCSR